MVSQGRFDSDLNQQLGARIMKRLLLAGVSLAAMGLINVNGAIAADASLPAKVPVGCRTVVDPYKNYACLDAYLGNSYFERLFNYYRLEWGHAAGPVDPKAPPSRRPESEVPPEKAGVMPPDSTCAITPSARTTCQSFSTRPGEVPRSPATCSTRRGSSTFKA